MSKLFTNKYILLDTCVISSVFVHPTSFDNLFTRLDELKCQSCINQFIYLEFIRICKSQKERKDVENFIQKKFLELPFDLDIDKNVKSIYPLYNFCKLIKNPKQASVVDVLNIAFLKKYGDNLLLMTLDHNDYPLEILKRIYVGAIDLEREIITWGIYKFNKNGFEKLNKYFEK